MAYRCLIIEAEPGAADAFCAESVAHGIKACAVVGTAPALSLLRQWHFDAVLLGADGFGRTAPALLRRVRAAAQAPVLLLTRAGDETSQILWLEAGASEVVVLPASVRLVTVKLRRLIEAGMQAPGERRGELHLGPLSLHPNHGIALVDETPLPLTVQQFDLLYLLASQPGAIVPRQTIATVLRGPLHEVGRSADVHVYRIRKKLRARGVAALHLETMYGRGYRLTLADDPARSRRPAYEHPPGATAA